MFITTKGRYALRVLLYLADRYGIETVPLKKIAKDEEISLKYLEHIIARSSSKIWSKAPKDRRAATP